jgi:hypothetical protein
VLQYGQGYFHRWAKGDQQRRDRALASATWVYDTRRLDGISLRKEAGLRKGLLTETYGLGHTFARANLLQLSATYLLTLVGLKFTAVNVILVGLDVPVPFLRQIIQSRSSDE